MKVFLLLSPPLKRLGVVGQIYPPLGMLYLAGYVREHSSDFEFKALDGYQLSGGRVQECIDEIEHFRPDVLGVSMTTQGASGGYAIIDKIRETLPATFIVTGGPHVTTLPEDSLERSSADCAVIGEGEVTFYELLCRLRDNKDWRDIQGVVARADDGKVKRNPDRPYIMDLDSIPFPARDLINIREYPGYHYKLRDWDTSFLTSRGCPYHCNYCSDPVWKVGTDSGVSGFNRGENPWLRLRSPENIVAELEYLKSTYDVHEFYDQTDLFNGSRSVAKKTCQAYIDAKLDIKWKVQMTVRNFDEDLASLMARSGCWLTILGIETANDETLKGVNKRCSADTAEQTLRYLKKNGMKTFALLMAFNVWEEKGELKFEDKKATMNTFKFAEDMIDKGVLDFISWSLTTPYPGSPLWGIAQRHNLIPDHFKEHWEEWDSSSNMIMQLPGVTEREWKQVWLYGQWLKTKLLFKSGNFNIRSIPLYARKGKAIINTTFFNKTSDFNYSSLSDAE